MSYFAKASKQVTAPLNPVIFSLRPESQWTLDKPKDFEYVAVRDPLLIPPDVVVSRRVEDRWVYDIGSSLVRPDFGTLDNFDLLLPTREILKTERRAEREIPNWIRKWGEEFEADGMSLEEALEEARRVSRKLRTPLSEEVIAEREGRR